LACWRRGTARGSGGQCGRRIGWSSTVVSCPRSDSRWNRWCCWCGPRFSQSVSCTTTMRTALRLLSCGGQVGAQDAHDVHPAALVHRLEDRRGECVLVEFAVLPAQTAIPVYRVQAGGVEEVVVPLQVGKRQRVADRVVKVSEVVGQTLVHQIEAVGGGVEVR